MWYKIQGSKLSNTTVHYVMQLCLLKSHAQATEETQAVLIKNF